MGKVKLMRHTTSGREVLLDVLRGGDYFGNLSILGSHHYTETALAQTDCCILQISVKRFEKILERHPDVLLKVLKAVGERLEESQEIIKQLSVYSAEQRIAAALIRLAKKLGDEKMEGMLIQLPFSRQDLAAMTGATVETVSRIMSHFSAEGWVSTGRKWVMIHDLKQLEEILKEAAVN
jgi:CRP-like cAMP-binding protein